MYCLKCSFKVPLCIKNMGATRAQKELYFEKLRQLIVKHRALSRLLSHHVPIRF